MSLTLQVWLNNTEAKSQACLQLNAWEGNSIKGIWRLYVGLTQLEIRPPPTNILLQVLLGLARKAVAN